MGITQIPQQVAATVQDAAATLKYQGNRILDEGWNKNWVRTVAAGFQESDAQWTSPRCLPGCSTPSTVLDLLTVRNRSWCDETVKSRAEVFFTSTETRRICARQVADSRTGATGCKRRCWQSDCRWQWRLGAGLLSPAPMALEPRPETWNASGCSRSRSAS